MTQQIGTLKMKSKEGSASVWQQKKIEKLNQTLLQEQLSTAKERNRIVEVGNSIVIILPGSGIPGGVLLAPKAPILPCYFFKLSHGQFFHF